MGKGGKKKKQSKDDPPSEATSGGSQDQAGPSQSQQPQPQQSQQSQPQAGRGRGGFSNPVVGSQPNVTAQSQQQSAQDSAGRGRGLVRGRGQGRGRGGFSNPVVGSQPNVTAQSAPQPQQSQQQSAQDSAGRGRGRGGFSNPVVGSQPNVPPQQTPWGRQPQQPAQQQQQHPAQQQKPPQQQQQQQRPSEQHSVGSKETKAADVKQTTEELSQLSLKETKDSLPKSEKVVPILTVPANIANIHAQQIPKRKNPMKAGTKGRPITVKTNMMAINVRQMNSDVVHYDVDIVPNTPKYLMRPVFLAAKKKLFPNRNPAFDGKKNAFSAGDLPIKDPSTAEVVVYNEDGREKTYTVTMKIANRIDLSWLKTVKPGLQETERNQISLQALDIILRNAPALTSTSVGRSFFTPPKGQVMSLGGGMDLWVGLFQSAVLGWKPYLNIDVAHKGFPKPQSVLDLMKTICGCDDQDQGGRQQYGRQQGYGRQGGYGQQQGPATLSADLIQRKREEIRKFLKGLKVTIEIPGQPTSRRTQRVNDLVKPPRDNIFEHNGHNVTVEHYYKIEKKYTIKYPDFPCLWVGGRDKNVHVPPEICTIVGGQATQKKLDENQTSSMIKFAATGTEDRKRKIMDAFNSMRHNQDPCMKEFGISVSGEFETVPARVLDPPQLKYQRQNVRVAKGVWRASQFINPSPLIAEDNTWTVLNLDYRTRDDGLYRLVETLRRTGQTLGMPVGNPLSPFKSMQLRGQDIRELMAYFNEMKMKKIKLVVVVVPEMKGPYSKVKQMSELRVGVLTQCLKSKTLFKLNDATAGNILLKINAKLNGTNHIFEETVSRPPCLKRPCMIIGADVTHPSPDATNTPSIAAVAASHDPNAFKYNVEIRLQRPKQEIIVDLAEIMKIQLKYFYTSTGYKPERLIFYRDGVSEGQFGQIMHAELLAIRNACQSIEADYRPKITFFVVQKRHHTRLFPTDPSNSDDRNFNVQAGTVVDTEITHPSHIDFYLVSHASIQGTSRPTKYRCLWDDSDMSEDEIENLTYFLCHMFSRCTRSVSYPTPTYYAHLAAFRARALIQDVHIDMNNLPQEQLKKLTIKDEVLKDSPMFFV
ncbi:hypothetical protein TSAR_010814 [Trichomalopsis sarcophagae]|uniref:Piwi domain-containing protein n=1 Tax=Trichomalopsis sarcophagae TaxID=543379 RepID=A0A232F670_9HYME|nr:hypothetical protein TSAR_010814 [Trichomalopsis sarcophagae]